MLSLKPAMMSDDLAAMLDLPHNGEPVEISQIVDLDALSAGALAFSTNTECTFEGVPGCVIAHPGLVSGAAHIESSYPRRDMALLLRQLQSLNAISMLEHSIDPTAIIHPNATIEHPVRIGKHTTIGPAAVIHANVSIGNNVVIGAGTIIGHAGFGIVDDLSGAPMKIPHLAGVDIGDNCIIGVGNTVCAGVMKPTKMGAFNALDDHIHIAHNVQVGERNQFAAGVKTGGSTVIGDNNFFGISAVINNKLIIGDNNLIGSGALIARNVESNQTMAGLPARKIGKT